MKKITTIAVIAALAVMVSGCDFIRQIAGRPTTAQIEAMDAEDLEEAVEEAACCCDTLCVCDSCCCADSLCCKEDACCKDSLCCKEACDKACEKECVESCEKPCEGEAAVETPAEEPVVEPVAVEKPAAAAEEPVVEETPAAQKKYCVVIGTFSCEANAAAQVKRAEKAGYEVVTFPIGKKLTAVAVAPTDVKAEAFKTLKEVKTKKFCPADAYVFVVK
ncbi:MAG: SPOR domain-containing protein [Bacteroidales bacterium]|nr:SPOR domain-containing protein [Bacteroidales bacterium]